MFVTELPQDLEGSRALTNGMALVVEVIPRDDQTYEVITAPEWFSTKHPILQRQDWIEVDGPTRAMTNELEWVAMIKKAHTAGHRIHPWQTMALGIVKIRNDPSQKARL